MKRTSFWAVLILAAVVAAGCTGERERVMLPPEAPVTGIRSVAVVGFANYTVDPGISVLFEESVAQTLRESGQYLVVDVATARAALAAIGATPEQLADPNTARALGRRLGVDAIITGAATDYFDDVSPSATRCFCCRSEAFGASLRGIMRPVVYVAFQGGVVEAKDGASIWSKTVDGQDSTTRTVYLSWGEPADPP